MRYPGFVLVPATLLFFALTLGCAREHRPAETIIPPTSSFVKTWGGGKDDDLSAVAVDSSGNIYCAGWTESFGAGQDDSLLLKYDSSGALQWAKTWGGSNNDHLHAIAVDSFGNIYCAGRTNSFGAGLSDALLLKYNSSGTLQWAKTWGGGNDDWLNAVAVDSSRNIYCAGYTDSFGAGQSDALLLKYDSSGALQWAKTWGGSSGDGISGDFLYAVVVDSSGNIYCAGYTASFGAGYYDALLLKYDSSGTLRRAKTWGGSNWDFLCRLALDSSGNIYCAGETLSFSTGSFDTLLLKYNNSGALQWAKTWGCSDYEHLFKIAVDSLGNVYCAGETNSFGAGEYDGLLLKYDSSGALQWAKTWGCNGRDALSAVAVDSIGNLYLSGYTEGSAGVWQEVIKGIEGTPSGSVSSPTGTEGTPTGTEASPAGTQTSPTGSETGAGESDTLLLRYPG